MAYSKPEGYETSDIYSQVIGKGGAWNSFNELLMITVAMAW